MKNTRGFSPIIILIVLGVLMLGVGIYSIKPWEQQHIPDTKYQIPYSKVASPSATLTPQQKDMVKFKDKIKKDLSLTEEQFNGLLDMSGDADFKN